MLLCPSLHRHEPVFPAQGLQHPSCCVPLHFLTALLLLEIWIQAKGGVYVMAVAWDLFFVSYLSPFLPTGPAAGTAVPTCAGQVLLWAHTELTALAALLFAQTLPHLLWAAVHQVWGWKTLCISLSPGSANLWGECSKVPEVALLHEHPLMG